MNKFLAAAATLALTAGLGVGLAEGASASTVCHPVVHSSYKLELRPYTKVSYKWEKIGSKWERIGSKREWKVIDGRGRWVTVKDVRAVYVKDARWIDVPTVTHPLKWEWVKVDRIVIVCADLPFSATTSITGQPDTTTGDTSVSSPDGNVWAYDNLTETFRITSLGDDEYAVMESVHGTFNGFDQPDNADASAVFPLVPDVSGTITGTNSWTVESTVAPHGTLPGTEPAGTSESTLIPELFVGGSPVLTGTDGGNAYVFTYEPFAPGQGSMVQNGLSTPVVQGNITN
jgi:hypothetical protein